MRTNKASIIMISKHFARNIRKKRVGFVLRERVTFCRCRHLGVSRKAVMLCALKARKIHRWRTSTLYFVLMLSFYEACPESKDTKVLNMYNIIFNLQKQHCELLVIICT